MIIKTNRLCKGTIKVINQIANYPSWRNGIAAQRLIYKVQDTMQGCFEMLVNQALKKAGKPPLNWLKYEIDVSKVYLGQEHYQHYVKPLYHEVYEEYLPKTKPELEKNAIEIPSQALRQRKFGWWKAYIADEPDFIQELKYEYLKEKQGR